MGLLQRGLVEIPLVEPSRVNVERFLVDLGRVESRGQHQRCVHLSASIGRQNVSTEVQQTVHQEHDSIFIAVAITSLGRMEKGMGVASGTVCPTDDSRENPPARVGCERANEMPDEVVGLVSVVIRLHLVKANQQFIDVLRRSKQEIGRPLGDDEILRENFQRLLVVLQWTTAVIMGVAQTVEFFPRHTNLTGPEVGDGNIAHVVANRTVSEDGEFVSSAKNAFFDGFWRLVSAVELLGALHLRRKAVNAQTDTCVLYHLVHANGLDFTSAVSV